VLVAEACRGASGPAGAPGMTGSPGEPGAPGSMGLTGVTGMPGGLPQTSITPIMLPFGRTDNYAPVDQVTNADLSTALVARLMSNDNEGSWLSGLAAGSVGDFHVLCNQSHWVDGGQLTLLDEDSHSSPANRFTTPDQTDYRLPSNACAFVTYDQSQRWLVLSSGGRAARTIATSLQLDSYLTPAPITGSVDDWAPIDATPYPSGYCLDGNSCKFKDNTIVRVTSADTNGATLTGMQWLSNSDPAGLGPVKILINYGPGPIVLANLSSGSSFNNQIQLPANQAWTIPFPGSATLWHGSNEPHWQLIAAVPSTTGLFQAVTTQALTATTSTTQLHNLSPAFTPSAWTAGKNNDWTPGAIFATSTIIRGTGDASGTTTLTGISAIGVTVGDVKIIHNFGAPMSVSCSDPSSQPQNQILCPATFTLATYAAMTLRYDELLAWFVTSHT
jgi:hypothetical protein